MQQCPGWKARCAKAFGSDRAFARPRMSLRSCGNRCSPDERSDIRGTGGDAHPRMSLRSCRLGHGNRCNPDERSDIPGHDPSDTSEDSMNRRRFLKSTASLGIALASPPLIARAAAKELLVAEPVHST